LVKFIFFSFIFHLILLIIFKFQTVDLRKSKEKAVNISISQENQVLKKEEIPKNIKPNKNVKKKIPKSTNKNIKLNKNVKKEIPKKVIKKPSTKGFDDLLKNLAKKELTEENKESFDKKLKELSEQTLISKDKASVNKLNKNELNAIEKLLLKQIDEKWSRPPGITISKDLVIKMIVNLDINGRVINLRAHEQTVNDIKNNYSLQPYLESAIRAIKKASPFEGLRKDRYNSWKELVINFKPIEAR